VEKTAIDNEPLISVVITCYNHGTYLHQSIGSILQQEYSNYEIILVDDGSVDDTKTIAANFPSVKYVYQENSGLSAARNTGIKFCNGRYLIFLDADDWLLPYAMKINCEWLEGNKESAFVSGAYEYFFENEKHFKTIKREVSSHHYCRLLEGNYIGMHATVLYQRWVFDEFLFDIRLKACEDYDLYLKIARKYPVMHHTVLIAVYRMHQSNMSGNAVMMVNIALEVLARQKPFLINAEENACFNNGIQNWKLFYGKKLYDNLLTQLHENRVNRKELATLQWCNKQLYEEVISKQRTLRLFKFKNKVKGFVLNLKKLFQ
jgi:glycosyltransferase involved in cell wall biosynthesis